MSKKTTISVHVVGALGVEEAIANAALSPGHLIELMSTGKVRKHSGAGLRAVTTFALEDSGNGRGVTDDYDTTTNSRVIYRHFQPGERVQARLADGQNVAIGDFLESNGDGTLRAVASDTSAGTIKVGSLIGIAREAVDMSGSPGVDPEGGFITVEIM